jgi:hypothetical protein
MSLRCRLHAVALATACALACAGDDDAAEGDAAASPNRPGRDGGRAPGDGGRTPRDSGASAGGHDCVEVPNQPPELLSCAGLYADIEAKDVEADVHEFAPAHELWSDGAEKQRWIHLPEGTQIDSSDPGDFRFPVGTKLFKEFSWNGHRVETRMFWKTGEGRWLKAAYHWNEDETAAVRFAGGEVDVAGETYYIPSAKECDQCHKGRADRALGFELISLGLSGASGLTLDELIERGLLSETPAQTELEIGDDGTGNAAAALGWLHVNCGVSCHNGNPAAEGYSSDLRLRLPADGVFGGSTAGVDALTTTVDIPAQTPRWSDRTRIVPGSPEDSLLYVLASTRDPAKPKDQMPPIASRRVHDDGLRLLEAWISSMPASP